MTYVMPAGLGQFFSKFFSRIPDYANGFVSRPKGSEMKTGVKRGRGVGITM
jgi:hypothetical protein